MEYRTQRDESYKKKKGIDLCILNHSWKHQGTVIGFLKIHVTVDVKSKQITGVTITDDHSHDSKHFELIPIHQN